MAGKGLNLADTINHGLDSNFVLSEDDEMKAALYKLTMHCVVNCLGVYNYECRA